MGGISLDPTIPTLTQEMMDEDSHRSIVTLDNHAPISCASLLADDASSAAIHPVIVAEAMELLLAGKGLLISARWHKFAVEVWTGLLLSLNLFTSSERMVGYA